VLWLGVPCVCEALCEGAAWDADFDGAFGADSVLCCPHASEGTTIDNTSIKNFSAVFSLLKLRTLEVRII
jgi:hypothetical protein